MLNKKNINFKNSGIKKVRVNKDNICYYIDANSERFAHGLIFGDAPDDGKTRYYIIENANFASGLYLYAGKNTNVFFKSCKFHQTIYIDSKGTVIFNNNSYYGDARFPMFPKNFFSCKCERLQFINETLINKMDGSLNEQNVFGLDIKARLLTLYKSIIKISDANGMVKSETEETLLVDSIIDSPEIEIKADNLYKFNAVVLKEQRKQNKLPEIDAEKSFESLAPKQLVYKPKVIGL